ncbi:MAG: trigger factor [Acidimicrobiia bacterium]
MKTAVEPLEGNKVKLSVEVEESEMDSAAEAAIRRIAREVRIPGFRPGEAPRRLLESKLGTGAVRQEVLRDALPDFYARAIRETELDAIAPPEIDITDGEEGGNLAFDAVVEVRPKISVPGYDGLRVTVISPKVSDEEIDRQIDRMRAQFGELNVVERAVQEGDFVTIDIAGTRDGEPAPGLTAEDYLYEVGTGSVIADLDEQLVGASAGDERTFTADVGSEEPVDFVVRVKEVKERILPEVDDEWASEASEFETVDELRADIAKRLEGMKRMQATMSIRDEAVRALVELVTEEPPAALVGAEVERRLHDLLHRLEHQGIAFQQYLEATGQTQEQIIEDLKNAATDAVKADLALRAVADAENIEASDEDIENEVEQLAAQMQQSPTEVMLQLERADQVPAVRSDIRKAKALGWLVEHVEVVDPDGNPIDRADLEIPNEEETTE